MLNEKKTVIMISFREGGENSGPYHSHKRIVNSSLKEQYNFVPLIVPKGRIGMFNIKLIKKLRKDILEVKPDIVHIGGLQLEGFYLALACKLSKIDNTVLAIHGSSLEAIHFPKWKKWIVNILEIMTLKMVKTSYGVSKYVSNWERVKKYSQGNYGYIYNLPHIGDPKVTNNSIRNEFGLSHQDIVIVSTGRITREKGFALLTQAIKRSKLRENVKYVIVGDGEYYSEMKREIADFGLSNYVIMVGYRNDVQQILSESDIFVLCSYHETLCNSIIEAAKEALPLVATNVGGIPEIIVDGHNGFLVPINDCEAVVRSLEKLIVDEDLRRVMGKKSKELLDEKFNSQKIIQKIENMYKEITNSDRKKQSYL